MRYELIVRDTQLQADAHVQQVAVEARAAFQRVHMQAAEQVAVVHSQAEALASQSQLVQRSNVLKIYFLKAKAENGEFDCIWKVP